MNKVDEGPKKIKPITANAKPDFPTIIMVPKDQVRSITIGDEIKVTVSGEVSAIRKLQEDNPDKSHYEVELTSPKVIEVEANQADMALKKMVEQK